jgi:drug/metabolite transporter, DME family
MNRNYLKGIIFIMLAALFWSSAGLMIKISTLSPLQIAFYRSLIAGIFLLGVLFWNRYRYRLRFRFSIDRWSLLTAVCYTGTVTLFVTANKLTTAANAVFLQYMAPAYVIMISYLFLKERIYFHEVLTVILCLAGMGLFFIEAEKSTAVIGNIIGILSGIAFALLQLFVKRTENQSDQSGMNGDPQKRKEIRATYNISLGNLMTVLLIGVIIIIVSLATDGSGTSLSASEAVISAFSITMQDFYILLFLGICQLGLGYVFFTKGVHYISSVEVSIYTLLEPICNPVWTFLGTGEQPGIWAMVGGALVLVSLVINSVIHYSGKPAGGEHG